MPDALTRVSGDENDPGYPAFMDALDRGFCPVVMLDGVEMRRVVTADAEMGFVLFYPEDENGKPQVANGCFLTAARTGEVRITLRPVKEGA